MVEFSGPTDRPLEDTVPGYPTGEIIKLALREESERSQALLDEEAERRKKRLPRTGLIHPIESDKWD